MITRGADVNIPDKYHETPLWAAASRGYFDVSKLLLDHGADVNIPDKYHETPLWAAASNGHFDVSKLLLDHGVDVNIPNKDYETTIAKLLCQTVVSKICEDER